MDLPAYPMSDVQVNQQTEQRAAGDDGKYRIYARVEIAFILPVALVFRTWVKNGQGIFAFIEILMFLSILLVGLVYVWAKGDFDWIKRLGPSEQQEHDEAMKEAA